MSIHTNARLVAAPLVFGSVMLTASAAMPQQLPTGGSVTHGTATIGAPQGGTLNINQASNRAIINWNSFSVGAGGTVNFNQPSASAATLNRVTGATPSSIAGAINASGTVLLVNPNGIAITPTGTVNTGSFAASTLDIKNSDFLAGNYKFTGNGSSATVTNAGRINVSDGGFAALLGGRVANDGVISARLGKVGLGSGEMITLDLSGDGFLSVAVPSNQLGNLHDGTGQALVTNRGKIRADGGTVFLSAATANTILRDAVHVPGSIRANSVGTRSGRIVLGGGEGGRVTVSGQLSASGTPTTRRPTQKGPGGKIDISGAEIALNGAQLNASGATGGGKIRIGGDYQGTGDFQRAQNVSIDSASVIRADVTETGNGGTVIVWSDGSTSVSGVFSARGGANGGNGGLVETSGHLLAFTGARVDVSAPQGKTGDWLLDPVSLAVDSAAAATISANLATANVTLLTTATGASGPGSQWNGDGAIFIGAPITWTSANTLRLNAYYSIYIDAAIVGGAGSTLWLTAPGVVAQSAPISVSNLVLPLNFSSVTLNNAGNAVSRIWTDMSSVDPNDDSPVINPGSVSFTNNGNLTIADVLYARNLTLNVGGSLTAANANSSITNFGTTTSIVTAGDISLANFYGASANIRSGGAATFGGAFTTSGNVSVRAAGNIYFDQNISDTFNAPIASVTLRSDNGLVSFRAGKQVYTSGPVDIFYNPYVATGSYTNVSTYAGLTSGVGNGSVTAYMLVNNYDQLNQVRNNRSGTYALGNDIDASASMTCNCRGFDAIGYTGGGPFTGIFDGRGHVITNLTQRRDGSFGDVGPVGLFYANDGTIRNLGIVGGTLYASNTEGGAIASVNRGVISNSYSTATVTGFLGSSRIGGLVGLNHGTINGGSYATGAVTGYIVGGLVGENRGIINDSYATGTVSGAVAGGLVGENSGNIRWTYALGAVNGTNYTGGLVGNNRWFDVWSYGSIRNSYAAGRVTGAVAGGLVGRNEFRDFDTMDSFNQQHSQSARVWHSYFDVATTGTNRAFGWSYHDMPGGWSSEQIMYIGQVGSAAGAPSAYAVDAYQYFRDQVYVDPRWGNQGDPAQRHGWDDARFNDHWYIIEGETRPFLRAEYSTNIQNLHQLQLIDMNGAANYRLARNIDAGAELATGMWKGGSFSPIRPVTWTDIDLPIYVTPAPGSPTIQVDQLYVPEPTAVSTFTGTFDGQGHTIRNLYVNRTLGFTNPYSTGAGNNAGLFDTIGSGGTVRDVGIVNSQFITSTGYAGSIAGLNWSAGVIERSYATRGAGTFDNNVVSDHVGGGLVGYNDGGLVSQSYASVNVYGVGQSMTDYQFYATLGGLVGQNGGTIENAYATGRVLGNGIIGGLVGANWGTIRNTYAAGELGKAYSGYGIRRAGPIVGETFVPVYNSYYNTGMTAVWDVGTFEWAGTGLTTAQMQDLNTFRTVYQGFDFRNVWIPPNQVGQSGESVARYPEFYWANHVAVVDSGNATRVYGDANSALLASIYGLRSYDTATAVPITVTTNATASSNVGTYQTSAHVTIVPPTAVGCGPCSTGSHTTMGMRVNGIDVLFSRTATLQEVVNRFNAETWRTGVTAAIRPEGGFTLTSANTFTYIGMGVTVGDAAAWLGLPSAFATTMTVRPTQLSAVSTDGTAYRILNLPGTLTVTPRPIEVTANGGSSSYGDAPANPGLSATGLVNGDTLSGLSNSFGIGNLTGAGSYTLNVNGTFSNANYTITSRNTGTWTVNPAQVTVTANGGNSVYGDAPSNPGVLISGLRNGDTLSGLANSFGINDHTGAGSYTLNVNGMSSNPNYVIATRNTGTWTVNPAQVTVTANGGNSVYGDSPTNPGLTATGLRNGDTLSGLSNAFGIDGFTNAGSYTLNVLGTFGNPNYVVTRNDGVWTVSPAQITVTALGGNSVYGQSPVNPGLSVTGLLNGDALSGLSNSFGIDNFTGAGSHTLSVNGTFGNPNYVVTRNDGLWTVNPAQITVTALGGTSTYGQSPVNPGLSVSGLVNGDVLSGLSNSFGVTNFTGAGSYTLGVNGTFGNPNYVVTRNNGIWTVNRAQVVVTANGGSSVYGQSPVNPGLSASGLVNGESVAVLTGMSNSFGINSSTGAGRRTLSVVGTLSNGNYVVTSRLGGTWTVDRAPITVTADPQSRLFSEIDPLLTYRITSGELFNTDRLAGALIRASGSAPGFYAITRGTLAASANYALTFVGSTFEIRPLPSSTSPSQFVSVAPGAFPSPSPISFQTSGMTFSGSAQSGPGAPAAAAGGGGIVPVNAVRTSGGRRGADEE